MEARGEAQRNPWTRRVRQDAGAPEGRQRLCRPSGAPSFLRHNFQGFRCAPPLATIGRRSAAAISRISIILSTFAIAGCSPSGESGPPPGAAPTFEYELSTAGCARFTVYRTNTNQTEVFVVQGDLDKLGIPEGVKDFDLASAPAELSVTVDMYPKPQKHLHLCTDIWDADSDKPFTWTAVRGKVRIERFPPEKNDGPMPTFRVKVTVTDAEFRDPLGHSAKCPHTIVLDSPVGWFAG
jgi:hypothetical protein